MLGRFERHLRGILLHGCPRVRMMMLRVNAQMNGNVRYVPSRGGVPLPSFFFSSAFLEEVELSSKYKVGYAVEC